MTDIASYIQSDWSWVILFVTALFVGMSKTGIQGLTLLTVPLLAMARDYHVNESPMKHHPWNFPGKYHN